MPSSGKSRRSLYPLQCMISANYVMTLSSMVVAPVVELQQPEERQDGASGHYRNET